MDKRETAIEKMVEALKVYRDNIRVIDGGAMVFCPSKIVAIEALIAWEEANEGIK